MTQPPFTLPSATNVSLPATLPGWIREHVTQYLTDPAAGHHWTPPGADTSKSVPTLLLLSRGRRSGNTLTLPLIYQQLGEDYIIIASKGGAPAHPAWYLNLAANAACAIAVGAQFLQAQARTLDGEERTTAWRQMAKIFPNYDAYQQAAGTRIIPVVAVRPVDGTP